MKPYIALAAAALLAGCATASPTGPKPAFDDERQAVIAPGYPLDYLQAPSSMRLVANGYEDRERMPGGASVFERGFTWATRSDAEDWAATDHAAAVMSAIFREARGTTFQPSADIDGREIIGGREVGYITDTGRFFDMAFVPAAIPHGAPQCAVATAVFVYSPTRQQEVAGEYAEGLPCDAAERLSQGERQAHRERAFQAFGLRR